MVKSVNESRAMAQITAIQLLMRVARAVFVVCGDRERRFFHQKAFVS
jgi:hypothetical protein